MRRSTGRMRYGLVHVGEGKYCRKRNCIVVLGIQAEKQFSLGMRMFLQQVPHCITRHQFSRKPASEGPPRLGRRGSAVWLSWATEKASSLSISSVAGGCRLRITSTESSICSSSPRHAVVVRVNNSLHLTHAEHSNNSKDMYLVFYLHTSKL